MELLFDLHTHTIFSHGTGTIEDNVKIAKQKGLSMIAITDHGFEHLCYAVKRKNLAFMKSECERLSKKYDMNVLLGVEANLLNHKGKIDVKEEDLKYLDIIIMGYHKLIKPKFGQTWFGLASKINKSKKQIERNTNAYINAIKKYDIKILTHLNYGIKVNVPRLADFCKERGVLIELNGKRINFDEFETEYMKKIGTKFILSSDAHKPENVGETNLGLNFVIKNNIDKENVVNLK